MMRKSAPSKMLLIATVVLALCISLSPTAADAQEDPWRADLREQLLAEKDCELNYLTDTKSYELLGQTTLEARAHCKDKRAFDATRSGSTKLFEFRSCEVVTC